MSSLSMTILLSTVCAASLAAQGWSGAVSIAQGTESLRNLTGKSTGFALEGAYTFEDFRVGLDVTAFSAGDHARTARFTGISPVDVQVNGPSLRTVQVYGALRTPLTQKLNFFWGLSVNKHTLGSDLLGQGGSKSVDGLKLGLRTDLEYQVSKQLSALVSFQVVELGVEAVRTNSVNPSWFNVGVRWHF